MTALREMIEGFGEARTSEILRAYRSVRDSDTESFLRDRAVEMEKRDLSRTYLFLGPGPDRVLGYVTLGIKCLAVPEGGPVSGRMRRAMNTDARTNVAQAYLLGQLSRSADAPKGTGAALLDLAFEHFDAARREVGCRMVRLDCRDELVPYYSGHGFRPISKNADGNLNQMVALIRGPRSSARLELASGRGVSPTLTASSCYAGVEPVPEHPVRAGRGLGNRQVRR